MPSYLLLITTIFEKFPFFSLSSSSIILPAVVVIAPKFWYCLQLFVLGTNATIPNFEVDILQNLVTIKSWSQDSSTSDGIISIFSPDHFWFAFRKGFFTVSGLKSNPFTKKESSWVVADIKILCLAYENEPKARMLTLYGAISILVPEI